MSRKRPTREARKQKKDRRALRTRKPARRRGRDAASLTLSAVMFFCASACLLLALKSLLNEGRVDWGALALMVALPLVCWLCVRVVARPLRADPMLVLLMTFLVSLGIVLLYGLDPERGLRQSVIYLLGIAMFAGCALSIRLIHDWHALSWLMIPAGLVLLLLPVAIGEEQGGAKNWISMPVIGSFQPSELVKLALLLTLAEFFSSPRGFHGMLPGLAFSAACLGVLMLQKDLGTALMYYLVTLLLFWAASSNLPLTLLGALGGVGAAVVGYRMFAHVRTRVAIWLNPWSDALGKGYQLVQALMAISSGGLFGLGLGMGQSRVIPAYSTDFIFAVLCEQFGILFGLCVVALYVILVMRGISIALRARTPFQALLALGVSLMIGLQTFVIIGGVVKLIPLTGITMPFVSYGGTSLVSCMGMVGLLCGVSAQNEKDRAEDERLTQGAEEGEA